jgi:hypothetical protein
MHVRKPDPRFLEAGADQVDHDEDEKGDKAELKGLSLVGGIEEGADVVNDVHGFLLFFEDT